MNNREFAKKVRYNVASIVSMASSFLSMESEDADGFDESKKAELYAKLSVAESILEQVWEEMKLK